MAKRTDTFNLSDLSRLSQDDRIAAMRMVAEGEISVDDAVTRLRMQTGSGDNSRTIKGHFGGGFARRAFRQNRGRLYLEIHVQKASAFCVLTVTVREGRDLTAMNKKNTADPQLKIWLTPDEKATKKKSNVRKNTVNPMFNETFRWEIRTGEVENRQLKIVVSEYSKIRRSQFMGSMTFPLDELFEEGIKEGWFRLLDAKRGDFQYIPFRPKVIDDTKISVRKGGPTAAKSIDAQKKNQPLPKLPQPPEPAPRKSILGKKSSKAKASTSSLRKIDHSSFNYLKVLGQGSFGKVLMAEHKSTRDVFAVKVLKKEVVVEDDDVDCTMTERSVLSLASRCPFLTTLVSSFQTPEHLYFVMEFVTGGDLMFHIQKQKRFSYEQASFYAGEICLGLWYMHSHGVLYRDLKLDNVMLAGDGHIKIADFGMCKENIWGAGITTTFCGTPGYLAPEIIREQPYGASVDFWSLGVLIFEMLAGDSPFEGDDEEELFDQILHHKVNYPSRISADSRSFIDGLLTRDPRKRLGCGNTGQRDIKSHPFFKIIDWDKLEKREVKPPFIPQVNDPRNADCFDPEFTEADTRLSPADPYAIANIDQGVFRNFSFVNEHFFGGKEDSVDVEEDPAVRRPALFDYAWYRPDLPRDEAARHLRGKPVGTFYVRESSSQPGCYAIAMVSENNKIWNGLVTPSITSDNRTLYKLFVKQKFESLPELIEYYCSHPVTTGPSGKKLCLLQ